MTDSTTRPPRTPTGRQLVEDEPILITGEHSMLTRVLAIEAEAAAPDAARPPRTIRDERVCQYCGADLSHDCTSHWRRVEAEAAALREALRSRHDAVCACPFDGTDDGCNLSLTGAELGTLAALTR